VGYQLKVSTDDVAAKASAIQAKATALEEQVGELTTQMTALAETWTGSASSSFQDLFGAWKGQANAIQLSLADISTALNNAGTNYDNAETANQRTFSR
jgi:6 kDa early secretory antigenic target